MKNRVLKETEHSVDCLKLKSIAFKRVQGPWIYFLITLPFLAGLFFAAGPILEGYSINIASRNYLDYFPSMLGRPLALLPEYLASYISGNSQVGYFLVAAFFASVKLFLVVTSCRKATKLDTLVLLTIVLTVPPWINFANERYFAAQLSLVFAIAAMCFEFGSNPPKTIFLLRFLAGMSYPPICFALLFSWVFSFGLLKKANGLTQAFTLQLGTAAFLFYFILVKKFVPNSYDSQAAGSISISNLVSIYRTLFKEGIFSIILIVLIISIFAMKLTTSIRHRIVYSSLLCLALPIASIGYAFNMAHVNDPHRVIFPMASALCFIAVPILIREKSQMISRSFSQIVISLSIILMSTILAAVHMVQWNEKIQLNYSLVNRLTSEENIESYSTILVVDKTEYFGDVYSMLNDVDVLHLALAAEGINSKTVICNSNFNYSESFASKYPIPAAKVCSELDINEFSAVLVVEALAPFKARFITPPYTVSAEKILASS